MKNLKFILTICVLFVLLIGVTVWALRERGNRVQAEHQLVNAGKVTNAAASLVKRYVDPEGTKHATFKAEELVATAASLRKGNSAISPKLLDTIVKALDIREDQIQRWMKIAYTSEARALRAERRQDSLERVTYFYKDKNLEVSYQPVDPRDTNAGNGTFDYKYDADLTITQYAKRNRVLGLPIGSKVSYIDISSKDPRTTIQGANIMTVKQDRPVFGLRLQGVTSYRFADGDFLFGPGLQFDLKRLSLTGAYLRSASSPGWNTTASARYDFLSF